MTLHFSLLTLLLASTAQAIQNVPSPSYGPPPSAPQRFPHREYGVPQKIPYREYGAPALKFGPPRLNFIGGGGPSSSSAGFHEQVKTHFGVPKPFYGPPHKPAAQYGPPGPKPQYGPPPQPQYGPPPQKIQQKPIPVYGPPKPNYGPPPPLPPQALPLVQAGPSFKPEHQPVSSYGPPPSGPLNQPPRPGYGPPPPNYGPPPLPNFQKVQQTTIIVGSQQNGHAQGHSPGQPSKQVQIQVDASGHTHSIAGSQAPFHTACDGWKPIPAPVGSYVENNQIDTQSGYSQVSQGLGHASSVSSSTFTTTQYNAGGSAASGISSGGSVGGGTTGSGSSTITLGISGSGGFGGLTDEQLVAVALQSGGFENDNSVHQENLPQALPAARPVADFNIHSVNPLEAQAIQLSLGPNDDSYSKPPADSYAPGSVHSVKFNSASSSSSSHSSFSSSGPGGNYGPPPPPPGGNYGPPPPPGGNYGPPPPPPKGNYGPPQLSPLSGNYGPPPPRPNGNYGPPPPPPNGNYGPPPPPPPSPNGNYGPPPPPLPPSAPGGNYGPPQSQSAAAFVHHHAQAGLGIQYGKQTGNLVNLPQHHGAPPSKPVAFRPPVPQGLFETIGATVQHLDQFGVKPPVQAPTYIPPAANEIPHSGPGIDYGPPLAQHQQQQKLPQAIIEQQLPVQQQAQVFIQNQHSQQSQQSQQQQQQHIAHAEYGVPPPPPQGQSLPPQPQYLPSPPQSQIQQQYLPGLPSGPQQFLASGAGGAQYSSSASATFENDFSATQHNHQYQSLPLQQEQPRFHDCGHGPNLVGGGVFNYQQQQQLQQYSGGASSSIAQSIPVAEQHTQFVSGPADSYGPPPSGGNEIDHIGYASQKSQVATLPDGTNPEGLPGLEGLNVLSAQKSQSVRFNSEKSNIGQSQSYEVQVGGNAGSSHDAILSADLLQSVLNAVEKPQQQHQPLPANHKAEARSDIDIHDELAVEEDPNEPELARQSSQKVEVKVKPDDDAEIPADVKELKPIVVKEEGEAKH